MNLEQKIMKKSFKADTNGDTWRVLDVTTALDIAREYAATQVLSQSTSVISSFLEIIKRIEHDEILCQCPLCKPESYNKRFIWSISETIKLIKKTANE